MTKMIKMSLIAAVAVTGMTSVASAKPLEEAIKGVDVSGYVTYRYDDVVADNTPYAQDNTYKAGVKLTTKVTDEVKLSVGTSARGVLTDATGDAAATWGISTAAFTYTANGLAVNAGKLGLNTPWTEGSSTISSTQNGTGVLATYTAGNLTFAGGHFVNTGINGTSNGTVDVRENDLTVAAVIAKVADLGTAQAWYVNVGADSASALVDGATAYSLDFAGKASVVDFDIRTSGLKSGTSGAKSNTLTKLVASANLGVASVTAGYASTGKDGGLVAFDGDADAGFSADQLDLNNHADSSAMLLSVGADVAANVNLSATYLSTDLKDVNCKPSEMYLDAKYTAAKNLYVSAKYGMMDGDDVLADSTHARLEIGFTF